MGSFPKGGIVSWVTVVFDTVERSDQRGKYSFWLAGLNGFFLSFWEWLELVEAGSCMHWWCSKHVRKGERPHRSDEKRRKYPSSPLFIASYIRKHSQLSSKTQKGKVWCSWLSISLCQEHWITDSFERYCMSMRRSMVTCDAQRGSMVVTWQKYWSDFWVSFLRIGNLLKTKGGERQSWKTQSG